MIYLVEFEAYDLIAEEITTIRFGTDAYTTKPSDDPANTAFEEGVIQPGNYERQVFDDGTTSGNARVGFGLIEIAIAGANRDWLKDLVVDGRPLRIYGLASRMSPWSARTIIFSGTMEQIEFGWTKASIRIRDRLEDLRKPIQSLTYAGTTTAGGMDEAEGTADDLKDRPKPMLWGLSASNFAPPLSNRFDRIYDITTAGNLTIQVVRDNGVPLTFDADYPTLAALRTATIPGGRYATSLATGRLRLPGGAEGALAGILTVDAAEGAAGQRSAPKVVRRILEAAGYVAGTDFVATDFDALHALNPAEVGMWIGPDNRDLLATVTSLLDSIGAYIVPDRLGVFRVGRVDAPTGGEDGLLDKHIALDRGEGIERLATNDIGRGVPASKVTIQYAVNNTVQTGTQIDQTAATEAVRAFVKEPFRTVSVENEAVKVAHKKPAELTFQTFLATADDALAEANRRLGIYSARRDRYRVKVSVEEAADIDLGDVITFQIPRFGLDAGKPFLVIGEDVDLRAGVITFDIYG